MRFQPAHAAPRGSVPPKRRVPKPLRTALSVAVAAVFGLVPTVMVAAPASAASAVLSIAAAQATEGSPVVFTLHNTGSSAATYAITTAVGDTNPATAGTDYNATPSSASITFAGTGTDADQTVSFTTTDDALYEAAEKFKIIATNISTGTDNVTAVGTINDNDAVPTYTLTASPTSVPEPASGTSTTTITARLSAVSGLDSVVTLNTTDATAVAGSSGDYLALSGTVITIAAGTLTATTTVAIRGDGIKDEFDTETFTVNAVATNVSPTTASATVSIVDLQTTPMLTLTGGGPAAEGATLLFPITVAPASEKPITVHWDAVAAPAVTGHGAATAVTDFTYPSSRTVTIPARTTTVNISVPLISDSLSELPEDFAIELSSPTNSALGTTVKVVGIISNGDTAPTVAITPTAVVEGDSGTTSKTFTATLSTASGQVVTAGWATLAYSAAVGKATPVKDYIEKTGTLTFPAGATTQTFTIDVVGDTVDEGSGETLKIVLTNLDGSATIGSPTVLTITDDDLPPTFSFADISMNEGNSTSAVLLPVVLTGSSDQTLTFTLADLGTGTAAQVNGAGAGDYDLLNTAIVIAPEMTTGYGVVLVAGDNVYEGDETVKFTVTAAGGSSTFVTDQHVDPATLTLVNDDTAPNFEINSVTGNEGDTVAVTGTVTGMSASATALNVSFAGGSSHGSVAADASDFTNPGAQTVIIPANTNPGTVLTLAQGLVLTNDTVGEPAETIIGTGFGLGNVGTVTEGIITIAESDGGNPAPTLTGPAYRVGIGTIMLTGTATAGDVVQLWAAPVANSTLVKNGGVVTADSNGDFAFSRRLTSVGVKYAAGVGAARSDEVTVMIKQDPDLTGGSTVKATINLTATGNPKTAGQLVTFQVVNSRGTWSPIGTDHIDASGTATATIKNLRSGSTYPFRAVVSATPSMGILGGISGTRRIGAR
jgi:hypothetical protein